MDWSWLDEEDENAGASDEYDWIRDVIEANKQIRRRRTAMRRKQWIEVAISFAIATVLTGATYAAGMYFGWISNVNWLEAFAVWTTYSCTYLCVMQSRINYPIGAISIAAFCVLYYQQNLLASMTLQMYLFPIMLYGWWRWGPDAVTRPVANLGWDRWTLGYVVIAALAYGIGYETNLKLGGSNAALDVFVLVGSILAQFLMDNKKIENWYVWLAVDVVSVYLLWVSDLKVTAVQMVLFIANAVWGWYEWRKTQKGASQNKEDQTAIKKWRDDHFHNGAFLGWDK